MFSKITRKGRSNDVGNETPDQDTPEEEVVETDNIDAEDAGNESVADEDTTTAAIDQELEPEEEVNADPAELAAEVKKLQNELAEQQDKYLRLAAEFDNYRKRTLREKTEWIQTAGDALLKDILPVMDDFERGLEMINQSEDIDSAKTGMELIYNKLKDFLESKGVKQMEVMNEPFDADHHDAVTNIPAPSEDMKGKVVDVIQKGYTLHDKIMRFPKVVVGE